MSKVTSVLFEFEECRVRFSAYKHPSALWLVYVTPFNNKWTIGFETRQSPNQSSANRFRTAALRQIGDWTNG